MGRTRSRHPGMRGRTAAFVGAALLVLAALPAGVTPVSATPEVTTTVDGATIAGTITGGEPAVPLTGATVTACLAPEFTTCASPVTTGADGTYVTEPLPDGDYRIAVTGAAGFSDGFYAFGAPGSFTADPTSATPVAKKMARTAWPSSVFCSRNGS